VLQRPGTRMIQLTLITTLSNLLGRLELVVVSVGGGWVVPSTVGLSAHERKISLL
jgi:hypothetical protein